MQLESVIRTIPDFPKPGIQFRDITTLLEHPEAFAYVIDQLAARYKDAGIGKVVAIESRGFTIGGALAYRLGCGMALARKKGKLPGKTASVVYDLEYGQDCIEMHDDALRKGETCLVVDDLLATGGTAEATCKLVEALGGIVAGLCFIVNLPDLGGAKKLKSYAPYWLVDFAGD